MAETLASRHCSLAPGAPCPAQGTSTSSEAGLGLHTRRDAALCGPPPAGAAELTAGRSGTLSLRDRSRGSWAVSFALPGAAVNERGVCVLAWLTCPQHRLMTKLRVNAVCRGL